MPRFSDTSEMRLNECHGDLRKLFFAVVRSYDCSILVGHRDQRTQNQAYLEQRSKVQWPNSKHNTKPSRAVDVAPYPIDWGETGTSKQRRKAIARFYHFAGFVLATSKFLEVEVRWGGDWDMDLDFSDQSFDDLVHWELVD